MFDFLIGSPSSPTGNLLTYSRVEGLNPILPDGEIIACNIVVSFSSAQDAHFPVVVFPPVSMRKKENLDFLIKMNSGYDVIQLEDFQCPPSRDPDDYIQERLTKLNHLVLQYVELCCDYIYSKSKATDSQLCTTLLERQERSQNISFHSSLHPSSSSVEQTESAYLDRLERYLVEAGDTSGNFSGVKKIIQFMKKNYPCYDVHNFAKAIGLDSKTEDRSSIRVKIGSLYLKKFRAIYNEHYEEAADLQIRIRDMENIMKKNLSQDITREKPFPDSNHEM